MFGVRTVARGKSCSERALTAALIHQPVAAGGHHHGVHHESRLPIGLQPIKSVADRLHVFRRGNHSRLHRGHRKAVQEKIHLLCQHLRCDVIDARHFPGTSATTQVRAVNPYTPRAENVFRSA